MKSFTVKVNGKKYVCEVEINPPVSVRYAANAVYAETTAKVLTVMKKPGAAVSSGDTVMILELPARTMQVASPCDGHISMITEEGESLSEQDCLFAIK